MPNHAFLLKFLVRFAIRHKKDDNYLPPVSLEGATMKWTTSLATKDLPKLLAGTVLLMLSACMSLTPQTKKSENANDATRASPGTITITGDQMKDSGRTNNDAALRALSPVFH
jgi:hypothetical protein